MLRDKTLLGLILAVVLMMAGVGMVVALLPQRIVEFDGNGQSVGFLAAAFAVSYLLFQVPIGSLSDKIGFKPFLILGYLLCCVAGLAFYYATSSNMIFFARLLQGAGEAPVWALAPALLSLKFPLARGKVMGFYNAAMHLGLTLGPILGVVLAKALEKNEVFLVYSVCCLVGVILICFLVETPADKKMEQKSLFDVQSMLKLIKQRPTLILLLGITLYGAGYGIFITTIPAFLLQDKAFSPVLIGAFFSLFYVAISLSQIITGPLSDKFGRNIFMIAGLLIVAAGITITPICDFPIILMVLMTASLGMGVFYLASMAFLNEIVADSMKGTISGAYYLFWGVGYFFGPLIITKVATSISFMAAMAGYSGLILLVAIGMIKTLGWSSDNRSGRISN